MFEMLGNQLFLVRNYARAAEMLEKALWKTPNSKPIRRKLIICYCQTGEVEKALDIFISLAKEDIDFIINTDPIADDCPCPEIVVDMENKLMENRSSLDYNLILGMLWLYCDIHRSYDYFRAALQLSPDSSKVKTALALIKARLQRNGTEKIPDVGKG